MNNVINKDIDLILENIDDIFDALNNKNILFAGGGGFLGYYFTNLFYKLANQKKINFKLYLIDNFVSSSNNFAFKKDLNKNIHFLNLDICQSNNLNFDDKFDYIIHASGIASPYYYRKKPIETLEVSIQDLKTFLNWRDHIKLSIPFLALVKYMAIHYRNLFLFKRVIEEM